MMFALGCIKRCNAIVANVPGIATQDKALYKGLDITEKSVRVHFHNNTLKALQNSRACI
jgi:glutamate synthase domain-containing protein 2